MCHSPPWNTANGRNHAPVGMINISHWFPGRISSIRLKGVPHPPVPMAAAAAPPPNARRLKKGMIPRRYRKRTSPYPTWGKAKTNLWTVAWWGISLIVPRKVPEKKLCNTVTDGLWWAPENGGRRSFPIGARHLFRCELLVSGRVHHTKRNCGNQKCTILILGIQEGYFTFLGWYTQIARFFIADSLSTGNKFYMICPMYLNIHDSHPCYMLHLENLMSKIRPSSTHNKYRIYSIFGSNPTKNIPSFWNLSDSTNRSIE